MKKNILFTFLLAFNLFSCNKNDSLKEKINVFKLAQTSTIYNKQTATFFYNLTVDELDSIIEREEDALVYVNAPNCSSTCGTFFVALEIFVEKNKIFLPYIEIGNLQVSSRYNKLFKDIETKSQFILLRKGQLLKTDVIESNTSSDFIDDYFNKNISILDITIANNLYYQNNNIKDSASVHLLSSLYDDENIDNYTLFNNIDEYLSKNKVLLINKNTYNFSSFYSYLKDNNSNYSIFYYSSSDDLIDKYDIDLSNAVCGYLALENNNYSYLEVSFSSIS